ncbi:hypothetical protein [Xanthomonas oryzae]|uniref:hypothetical protein n=1 Tax=Xanthomonas oryzae TaxID=347 RepID=UPI0010351A63|nr:hypothetical protein [Xanthomonas oryzae]QBH04133.1 hypothetical protein EYC57_13080 [Xanthomonas oryzae]
MLTTLTNLYPQISAWLNDNQGVVGAAIFAATVVFGWVSGIFSALRRRPKFEISLIDGPTFCCTYPTGKMHGQYEAHRTGIALYLSISNIGSAPSSISGISIGYHWHLRPFRSQWLKYTIGWFWLNNQSVALEDFQVAIGESLKVYPFLTQRNHLSPVQTDTFLDVGRSTNGVVYFEQLESWGAAFPTIKKGHVRLKVRVRDVFGGKHTSTFYVPAVALDDARKYCPAFGKTFSELHGEQAPDGASNNSFKPTPLRGSA